MNKDQVEGRAKEFSAKVKKQWGKLTDDEIKQAEGNMDELTAKIQKHYGDDKEEIKRRLKEFNADNRKTY